MPRYIYKGSVLYFDNCVSQNWTAETYAVSEKKAKSNLAYQWKRENGYAGNAMVKLPGKLTEKEN